MTCKLLKSFTMPDLEKMEITIDFNRNLGLLSWVAVAEWLARPHAKQKVCGSNPASYLC